MREIDTDAANANINSIAEAIISLAQEGALLVGKREQGSKRLPFDFQKQLDEGYVANFFARDGFEIKLSHQGRKRVVENGPKRSDDESDDRKFAQLAIEEARKSVPENDGRPHPMVGAVVVKNGQVLATAHRGEAEGNHAEYIALEKRLADAAVAGATVYTTLEPCTTRTHPKIPCVERLIERKVARVVMGMLDPDPRITGRGQRRLRSANIITDFFPHDLMSEVEELNREFTRKLEAASRVAVSTPKAVAAAGGALHPTTDVVDKWVSPGYERKSGVAKTLDEQGFDLGWASADKEAEKVEFEGWEYVLVDQPDGKRARLKIHDHPAVGGYLVLLKCRRPSK
jgi:pyrimidine deaminase RibD-like protein